MDHTPIRIIAVSDLHGNLPTIPPCDLLLVAGDICPDRGRRFDVDTPTIQEDWLRTDFRPWWTANPAANSHATWGNHDFIGEKPHMKFPIDEEITVNGVRIWFSPWTPQNDLPRRWAFMRPDAELERRYDAIPSGIDILVTHGPPYGYGDDPGVPLFRRLDPHLGSKSLLAAIKRVKPKVVICGHIHGGYGTYGLDGTTIYNVALVDEAYKPVHSVTEIDWPPLHAPQDATPVASN